MARSLDRQQQDDLSGFVNAIAAVAGYETSAEWARDSGYAYPNLTKLRAGKGAVDGFNLLRLIRAAAARAGASPEDLSLAVARALGTADADGSIVDRLEELSALVTEALQRLDSAAPQRTPAAPRNSKRAAR